MTAAPDKSVLPASLPPIGINRAQAAALIGISVNLFDRLVHQGLMPDARMIAGRLVWDVAEVTEAFRALPHRSVSLDGANQGSNPWD